MRKLRELLPTAAMLAIDKRTELQRWDEVVNAMCLLEFFKEYIGQQHKFLGSSNPSNGAPSRPPPSHFSQERWRALVRLLSFLEAEEMRVEETEM